MCTGCHAAQSPSHISSITDQLLQFCKLQCSGSGISRFFCGADFVSLDHFMGKNQQSLCRIFFQKCSLQISYPKTFLIPKIRIVLRILNPLNLLCSLLIWTSLGLNFVTIELKRNFVCFNLFRKKIRENLYLAGAEL